MERVGVVGSGRLGAGIAELAARAGMATIVVEVDLEAARAVEERLRCSLDLAAAHGEISAAQYADALNRVEFSTSLRSLRYRDLVVVDPLPTDEAALTLFHDLGSILVREDAILAAATSMIPIADLGAAAAREAYVLGIHFSPRAAEVSSIELVRSPTTSAETVRRMRELVAGRLSASYRPSKQDVMEMTPMRRSRALHKVGYDPARRVLRVQFRNGHQYDYLDVRPEVFEGLLESAHPWTEWGPQIREHEFRRVDV